MITNRVVHHPVVIHQAVARYSDYQLRIKADHDFVAQEQELKLNTDLTRAIHELTLDLHHTLLDSAEGPQGAGGSARGAEGGQPIAGGLPGPRVNAGSVVALQGHSAPADGSPQAMPATVEPSKRRRVCRSMPDPPILIVSPQDDAAFRRLAEDSLAAGADTPRALEAAVRERYPNALVRARELTAEPGVMWYVYREGHWVPRGWHEEGERRDG